MWNNAHNDNHTSSEEKMLAEHLLNTDKVNKNFIAMVHQFLLHHNFQSTAENLIKEATEMGLASLEECEEENCKFVTDLCTQILLCYKSGQRKKFFKLWNTLIPENLKRSKDYKILTLYLYVHFAVLPKRILLFYQHSKDEDLDVITSTSSVQEQPDVNSLESFETEMDKNINEGMKDLLTYLSTDGKELEHESQLRPFFALPYIDDPLAEPFLSKIFDKSWLDHLTENLETFLLTHEQTLQDFSKVANDERNLNHQADLLLVESRVTPILQKSETINKSFIVSNDRSIPFLEADRDNIDLDAYHEVICNKQSKSTQTHICGVHVSRTDLTTDMPYRQGDDNMHPFHTSTEQLLPCTQELELTKSQLRNVQCNYRKLNSRFHKLHMDYHKLISVAGELTAALDNSFRGQPIDLQRTLETCIKIFPDLFNRNIREKPHSLPATTLHNSSEHTISQTALDILPIPPQYLDYKKIKSHLINGSIKTKLYLLQALRWKITQAQPAERDEAIHEYVSSDLLGLYGQIASDNGESILPYLLTPGNFVARHPLQQSAARLLNTLASIRCGRDYLSAGSTVVNVIFKCLNARDSGGIDFLTWDMMLATLQKLSLRKQQRIYMIDVGLVEWLIYHLRSDHCRMSSYRLEYATALLMNLSLHQQARVRASVIAPLLISTILTLLSIDNMPALSYVNGALNNFLSDHVINEEAKKMNLSSVLEYYRKQKSGEIRKHLDHILKIHKREYTNNTEDEETADEDNEELDVLESQLEEDDPVKNHSGELYGEALLATYYSKSAKTTEKQRVSANKQPSRSTLEEADITRLARSTFHSESPQEFRAATSSRPYDPIAPTRDDAVCLYANQSSKESSETALPSSVTLASACESGLTDAERFSSIASLSFDNNISASVAGLGNERSEYHVEEEEAFLAKPKLSRTPP